MHQHICVRSEMLMHAHAVELEAETATELVHDERVALSVLLTESFYRVEYEVRVLHVSLVEREMHGYLLRRDALERGKVEGTGGI